MGRYRRQLRIRGNPALGVGDLDSQSFRLFDDLEPLLRAHVVGDLGGKGLVVHEQEIHIVNVVDKERLVAGRHHMSGLLIRTVSNFRHGSLPLEPPPDAIIDTLGLPP